MIDPVVIENITFKGQCAVANKQQFIELFHRLYYNLTCET